MNLVVKGTIDVKCSKCGDIASFDVEEFYYDAVTSEERQMGAETGYLASLQIPCPKCGNIISVESDIYEYPVGAVNDDPNDDSYIRIDGGKRVASSINAYFEEIPFDDEI